VGFAFVTSITPGPNNTMLLQSGVHYGLRATVPHMLGINLGLALLVACVALGLGHLLMGQPKLYLALRYACAAYMVFLVWRIGTAGDIDTQDHAADRPMRFSEAAMFQWINPKVWVLALGAAASYPVGSTVAHDALVITAICALINAPCLIAWAGFGAGVRDVLSTPRRVNAFNWTMAVLLALSIVPLFVELAAETAAA
jgi:threonine/homoserine/homoserine lactone efflux protein